MEELQPGALKVGMQQGPLLLTERASARGACEVCQICACGDDPVQEPSA